MINPKLPKVFYGGDYNPEQFALNTLSDDIEMFHEAGIDIATVGVFSWALMQTDDTTYDFTWLDEVIDSLYRQGIYVCLATPTAVPPAWMVKRYPDILRVDFEGRQRKFGGRANFCPNSRSFRKYASQIAGRLAEKYHDHPAVLVWHVSNEYAGACYCDQCEVEFRNWLRARYGSLEELNRVWNTRFWGHTFYDWDEIVVPNALTEQWGDRFTNFQSMSIDYKRFNSDSLLACYRAERDSIRKYSKDIPVTTNLMGTFKDLDYFRWASEMDVVSWDSYPAYNTPVSVTAMNHDLMRGLKDGQPFMLMEQTPSQQNWQPYNALKRPGVMRLWSYQAVAHGADTVMFFQLRRSRGACEKYHGAVIEHSGRMDTRVFREVAELGHELQILGDTLIDSRIDARVGILFDWDNWWAVEFSSGPSQDLSYLEQVQRYYNAFHKKHIQVDMLHMDSDFSNYDVIVAPVLYMVKPGVADRLKAFVESGGTFVTTFFSGIVDENDTVVEGGYPGELRDLLGIWVEEIDALLPDTSNRIVTREAAILPRQSYSCNLLCDLLHTETANVIADYGDDFYKGMPAVTLNYYGNGQAWYMATNPDAEFLDDFVDHVCKLHGIEQRIVASDKVEIVTRRNDASFFTFLLNHGDAPELVDLGGDHYMDMLHGKPVDGQITISAKDTMILQSNHSKCAQDAGGSASCHGVL